MKRSMRSHASGTSSISDNFPEPLAIFQPLILYQANRSAQRLLGSRRRPAERTTPLPQHALPPTSVPPTRDRDFRPSRFWWRADTDQTSVQECLCPYLQAVEAPRQKFAARIWTSSSRPYRLRCPNARVEVGSHFITSGRCSGRSSASSRMTRSTRESINPVPGSHGAVQQRAC
jgi:hypothetical protein